MKTNRTSTKSNRLWLVAGLILVAMVGAQLLGNAGGVSPANAQEPKSDPMPNAEATNTPEPTETPAFCPLVP